MFSTDLLNIVLDEISPKIVDTVLTSNVLLQILQGRVSKFNGKNKQYPVKYKKAGNGGSFSGFDILNTNYVDTTAKLNFAPAFIYQPIVLADTDLAVADTRNAVIDLIGFKSEEAEQELADTMGTQLYADGTGNGGKDILGLTAAIKTSGTYGWLDYSTYTTLQSSVDTTTALAALTLADLDTMYKNISSGNNVPDYIITTKEIFNKLSSLMATTTYVVNNVTDATQGNIMGAKRPALALKRGYTELNYRGMTIVADEKCTAGSLFMLNSQTWELLALDMSTVGEQYTPIKVASSIITGQYDVNQVEQFTGFSRSPFVRSPNQLGVAAHIVFAGNVVCFNPKRNGKFTALT